MADNKNNPLTYKEIQNVDASALQRKIRQGRVTFKEAETISPRTWRQSERNRELVESAKEFPIIKRFT